jgi:hypothetical protein
MNASNGFVCVRNEQSQIRHDNAHVRLSVHTLQFEECSMNLHVTRYWHLYQLYRRVPVLVQLRPLYVTTYVRLRAQLVATEKSGEQ